MTAGLNSLSDLLPDLLAPGLILVFCGTAASTVSARTGAYYANPSNAFWRSLRVTGLTPRLFAPREFRQLLPLGIGLTDLAKTSAGSDRHLRPADYCPAALDAKIQRCQPAILAFTSKTAWRVWAGRRVAEPVAYGWQDPRLGTTRCFVLPSPSGAARRYWDLSHWQELADAYHNSLKTMQGLLPPSASRARS